MAKDWDYAQMTHEASLAGGPEKWVELIKDEAFANGMSEMKGKMAPLLAVAAGLGAGGMLLIQAIQKRVAKRKEEKCKSAELAEKAEARLVDKLRQGEKADSIDMEPAIEE